jgi:hypothetical protein
LYGAGQAFDTLLDRLHDAGAMPPRFGRTGGKHEVWLNVSLPGRKTVERRGATLDIAAQAILDIDLSAGDAECEKAREELT